MIPADIFKLHEIPLSGPIVRRRSSLGKDPDLACDEKASADAALSYLAWKRGKQIVSNHLQRTHGILAYAKYYDVPEN
jgi:hypothetical protein